VLDAVASRLGARLRESLGQVEREAEVRFLGRAPSERGLRRDLRQTLG